MPRSWRTYVPYSPLGHPSCLRRWSDPGHSPSSDGHPGRGSWHPHTGPRRRRTALSSVCRSPGDHKRPDSVLPCSSERTTFDGSSDGTVTLVVSISTERVILVCLHICYLSFPCVDSRRGPPPDHLPVPPPPRPPVRPLRLPVRPLRPPARPTPPTTCPTPPATDVQHQSRPEPTPSAWDPRPVHSQRHSLTSRPVLGAPLSVRGS